MVRAADLLVRGGGTVTAGETAPCAGEMAVFCRPVVTAPALVRRDGSVAADGWLPDFVRLGEAPRMPAAPGRRGAGLATVQYRPYCCCQR